MAAPVKTGALRTLGRVFTALGVATVLAGGAGLVVASALPWAIFTVLRTEISIPGIALGWGGVTAGLGILVIAQFGFVRRFAWLGIMLGLLAAYLGNRAGNETGKAVVGCLLTVQRRLSPINSRLAQLNLPPIEPVGETVGSRRDHVGPGPGYTVWAGAVVAGGALLLLAGERLRHTCGNCRRAWSARHGEAIPFCPYCGARTSTAVICARCAAPILRGERFCAVCGSGTSSAHPSI